MLRDEVAVVRPVRGRPPVETLQLGKVVNGRGSQDDGRRCIANGALRCSYLGPINGQAADIWGDGVRSALGVEVGTGRCARAWADGRTEAVQAEEISDAPDAVALALGDGLDGSAWREWVRTRFGFDALEVTEDVARTYADDIAAGSALWALDKPQQRGLVVPVVPPVGVPGTLPEEPASSMGDFGDGQTMSEFGDGRSMSDFGDPTMADHGAGRSMSDFGDGRSMGDFGDGTTPPTPTEAPPELVPEATRRAPKARIAVAAAVVVAVVAVAGVALAAGRGDAPDTPVAATASTTEPEPTTTTTAVPAERVFDVRYTITSTNADQFEGGIKTGDTGTATVTIECDGDTCRFKFDPEEKIYGPEIPGLTLDGDSLSGTEQSLTPSQGLHGDCDRQYTESLTSTLSDGTISGDLVFTADPLVCPGPEQNTLHVFSLDFEGTETSAASESEADAPSTSSVESSPALS